ncbi:MAG: tRNA pseudouridine(38-40) synthase TruA [Crocinitomicaceae bacterium]
MNRYFLKLAYKGTKFFGWQTQPNEPSIQEKIEGVLTKINSGNPIKVVGCGRTDTGVHASEYYAHVDIPTTIELQNLKYKLNSMLPLDIVVSAIIPVHSDAHARFDAEKRTYHYFIHKPKDPFIDDISWFRSLDLDLPLMNEACKLLLKHTDFTCFSKVKTDVTNFNCNIINAAWIPTEKGYVFMITSNRFLRNMVRAIVGTMIEIGERRMSLDDFQAVLDSKDRSKAGQSVPAQGLFLAKVDYPYIQ